MAHCVQQDSRRPRNRGEQATQHMLGMERVGKGSRQGQMRGGYAGMHACSCCRLAPTNLRCSGGMPAQSGREPFDDTTLTAAHLAEAHAHQLALGQQWVQLNLVHNRLDAGKRNDLFDLR